jgi:hypothetical protein
MMSSNNIGYHTTTVKDLVAICLGIASFQEVYNYVWPQLTLIERTLLIQDIDISLQSQSFKLNWRWMIDTASKE